MFDKSIITQMLSQLIFGMLGALIVVSIVIHARPTIATVNVTKMVNSFVKETVNLKLSPDEAKQKVTQFGNLLNATVDEIAKKRHVILVPTEAVVAGSPDVTNEVITEIKRKINS